VNSTLAASIRPEPEGEEAVEYSVMVNWFRVLGVWYYRIRASGHYYPYQLKTILEAIKPKRIIPHPSTHGFSTDSGALAVVF